MRGERRKDLRWTGRKNFADKIQIDLVERRDASRSKTMELALTN